MMNELQSVTVFAPATSANVAVGFDILGFAVAQLGDEITLQRSATNELRIASIEASDELPYEVEKNASSVALQAMLNHLDIKQGFDLHIKKNIPLSSGLGGSSASSVAPLVALNQFLKQPLSKEELIPFALCGEEIACGAKHGDNVIPCLFGGITLIHSLEPLQIIPLPLIPLYVVLVHPQMKLDTRESRAVLKQQVALGDFVKQNAHLAAFISALYEKNYEQLAFACKDEVIEPMRAPLIPGFYQVKAAAYEQGALACSISGSGPTVFAFAKNKEDAAGIATQMSAAFLQQGVESTVFISPISPQGARVLK